MDLGRASFLAVAFATHAVVGYALVRGFTDVDPRAGLVLGVVPDADFCFPANWGWPFVHRGATHTPLFALSVVAGLYAIGRFHDRNRDRSRSIALAAGLAIGSHLAIDSLSPKGIPWLFPFETSWSPGIAVHGMTATGLLWAASIALVAWRGATDG
nr:metal-dependent hydrolase [Natrinema salifodinae]